MKNSAQCWTCAHCPGRSQWEHSGLTLSVPSYSYVENRSSTNLHLNLVPLG